MPKDAPSSRILYQDTIIYTIPAYDLPSNDHKPLANINRTHQCNAAKLQRNANISKNIKSV